MADPFDTLGVAARFDLDPKQLAEQHRELSKALHPDRYVGAGPTERRMSLSRAIEVNEAMRVLKDPVKRAEALAKRLGLDVGEMAEPKASPALLMDMMEAREELAEAAQNKDAARIGKLGAAMTTREKALVAQLTTAFESAPETAMALLGELRYVRRFLDGVAAFEETLLQ